MASAVPLDKGKRNKNDISNFRSVIVLNTFSKFYEEVIKKQLVGFVEHYLSPFIYLHTGQITVHNMLLFV